MKTLANILHYGIIVGWSIGLFELERWAFTNAEFNWHEGPMNVAAIVALLSSIIAIIVSATFGGIYWGEFWSWIQRNRK